jgi:O-antigen/teichoic acid export membrane protein
MRPTVLYDRILRPALQLCALSAATLTLASPQMFALSWAFPYLPTLLLAALSLHATLRRSRRSRGTKQTDHPRLLLDRREFWGFAAPRAAASVGQLALQRVDVVLVAGLAGLPAAAVYAVAGKFVILGQFVNQAISQAIQPRLAESLSLGDTATAKRLYQQGTAWLVLATWPLYLLVAAYAPVYLSLFGRHYAAGAPVTSLLAATMLAATGCGMVDMVLAMGGRTSWNLGNVALAVAVAVTADLILIPRYGAMGAALGLTAAVLTNNLLPLAQIGYGLRLHPFGHATFAAAGLAAGCFGVPALMTRISVGDRPTALAAVGAVATAAGALGYAAAAYRLRRTLGLTNVKGKPS